MMYILSRLIILFIILVVPFLVLIRGSVYIHETYNLGPWISIFCGIGGTFLILVLYRILAYGRFIFNEEKVINFSKFWKFSLLLLLGYCIHGVFFLSSNNIHSPAIKKEINELHPILRLSVSTLVLIDENLVITDASRVPEDYKQMGLPTNKSSLHYKQRDGYAYALDLRTNGRYEIRNFLIKSYFYFMGFNTLRHVGTDDHLHISLPCHYKKGSI